MNFHFRRHAFHPVILRGAKGEVTESMRKTPELIWILQLRASPPCRMTWSSAAAGWWSVGMNTMTQPSTSLRGTFSHGRKFSFTFWKSGFCNFVQNDCGWRGIIESMDSATPWKMTWGWGEILREKSSSFSLERGTSIAHWIYVYCNSGQALHAEWHLGEVKEWK